MSQILKQSTAYTFRLGPFVDKTDGNTQENALTIAYTDVLLSKAGGALAAKNETTALTGTGANAHYTCILNTTDTNTLGGLRVWCHISADALPVWQDFVVEPANIYDSLVAGSDNLQVDTTQWLGTACATPTTGGVPEVDVTYVAGTAQTAGDIIADTNDIQSKIGTPAGVSVSADIAAIEAQTDDIGVAGAGLTALGDTRIANLDATISSRATPAQILTTALTEAYAADGAAFTLSQCLFMLWAALSEFAISGTVITAKKLDGTTTAMTFTLDDGTNPTSRTRAT